MEGAIFAAFVAPWVAAGAVPIPGVRAEQGMPVPSHAGAKAAPDAKSSGHASWIGWSATDLQAKVHDGAPDWPVAGIRPLQRRVAESACRIIPDFRRREPGSPNNATRSAERPHPEFEADPRLYGLEDG